MGLVWGRACSYFVFGKRVCELEAFIGTTGVMGGYGVGWGAMGSVGPERLVILMGCLTLGCSSWVGWVVDLIKLVERWLIP